MVDQTISHYKILEKLGEGGMSVVYKARDLKLRRLVVLKFLAPYLVRDEQAQLRFLNEARVTSALDHPNICNIYEIDKTADGRFFMAMAYHEGETLKKRMRGVPLAVKTTRDESGSSHRYLVARRYPLRNACGTTTLQRAI